MTNEQLLEAMRALLGNLTPSITGNSFPDINTPLRERAIQQPVPAIANLFPGTGAIFQLLAPWIGQNLLGMQNPVVLPQANPGFNAFDAYYAASVTSPILQGAQQQAAYKMGGVFGQFGGSVITNFGANNLFGVPAQEFQQKMVNLGQSDAGEMFTKFISGTDIGQAISGGNAMEMENTLLRGRHLFGRRPGEGFESLNALDPAARWRETVNTQEFANKLLEKLYPVDPKTGRSVSVVADQAVSRGFKTEEMGEMALRMASGGMQVMQGGTATGMTDATRQMAKTMDSLGDLMGSRDMDLLFSSIEKLTQGDWRTKGNLVHWEDTFRSIRSMAHTFDVLPQAYISTISAAQNMMQSTLGITQEAAQLGVTGGGYTGIGVGKLITDTTYGIAHRQGVENNPALLGQIFARQTALVGVGMNSPVGRMSQQMAWFAQYGSIDDEEYAAFRQAVQTGDRPQIRALSDAANRQVYGDAETGRRARLNKDIMQQMHQATTGQWAVNAVSDVMQSQQAEIGQRVNENIQGEIVRTVQRAGIAAPGYEDRLKLLSGAVSEVFPDKNGDISWQAEVFKGIEEQGIKDGLTTKQIFQKEQDWLSTNVIGEANRKVQGVYNQGYAQKSAEGFNKEAIDYSSALAMRGQMGHIDDYDKQVGELDTLARKIRREPDSEVKARLMGEYNAEVSGLQQSAPPGFKQAILTAGSIKRDEMNDERTRLNALGQIGLIQETGKKLGFKPGETMDQYGKALAILKTVAATEPGSDAEREATKEAVGNFAVLKALGSEQGQFAELVGAGKVPINRELINKQTRRMEIVRSQYNVALMETESQFGVSGLSPALIRQSYGMEEARHATAIAKETQAAESKFMLENPDARWTAEQRVAKFLEGSIGLKKLLGLTDTTPAGVAPGRTAFNILQKGIGTIDVSELSRKEKKETAEALAEVTGVEGWWDKRKLRNNLQENIDKFAEMPGLTDKIKDWTKSDDASFIDLVGTFKRQQKDTDEGAKMPKDKESMRIEGTLEIVGKKGKIRGLILNSEE